MLTDTATAQHIDIRYVEKDYWITRSLGLLAQSPYAERVVFKGGTSLTKAYRLTQRFSEDIDLAINREFFGFKGDISERDCIHSLELGESFSFNYSLTSNL